MSRLFAVLGALLFVVVAGVVYVWVQQNTDQTVQFHLDLTRRVGAWEMAQPLPATMIVGGAFAGGFLLATLMFGGWGLSQRSRVRQLERNASFGP